ncbi:MAG TPA: peptidoglycan-binding protein [Candidatus Udaeobacter sp.]|nr:peptidoglycan-binding protein [Candidatus Udaeobacter sp.]
MKKVTSLLIGCSLALAGAALAQQPVEQQSPSKGKRAPEKARATQAQPRPNAAKPETSAPKQREGTKARGATNAPGAMKEHGATNAPGAMKEHAATNEPGAGKGKKAPPSQESATAPETNVSGQRESVPTPRTKQEAQERRKGMKTPASNAKASPHATPATARAGATAAPAAPATSPTGRQNVQANAGAKAKKPDPQKVQQIKSEHANFRAQPKPQQVPAVTFNQSRRIEGSEHWQGPQYEVFRSYHPERHDQGWYRSHYNRVELIGGGYYYWNNGYWYPAWGYDPSAEYYAYDGPIYVGHRAEPPDKVIADVQAVLQDMGYYKGEVDGLLGPLTREALTAYQADNGLTTTAAIDEPTLDSLGMG